MAAGVRVAARLEQEPGAPLGLVDPVLDQARGRDVVVLIAELMQSDPGNEFYDAKVTVLSEDIKHHVKEEEKRGEGLFAQAREAGLDLEALGEKLRARKEELLAEFKQGHLPPPQTRSFTGHTLKQGAPVDGGTAATGK